MYAVMQVRYERLNFTSGQFTESRIVAEGYMTFSWTGKLLDVEFEATVSFSGSSGDRKLRLFLIAITFALSGKFLDGFGQTFFCSAQKFNVAYMRLSNRESFRFPGRWSHSLRA